MLHETLAVVLARGTLLKFANNLKSLQNSGSVLSEPCRATCVQYLLVIIPLIDFVSIIDAA